MPRVQNSLRLSTAPQGLQRPMSHRRLMGRRLQIGGYTPEVALPKAQQLSFDDFAAPAPVRTASPVSQEPQGASKALQASTLQLHRQHNNGSPPGVATLPGLQLPPLHPGFHEDGRPRSYVEASTSGTASSRRTSTTLPG